MNLIQAVERACQEPTFIKALTWLAVWENERSVQQALEWQKTGVSTAANGNWDTCFEVTFEKLLDEWKGPIEVPSHCEELKFRFLSNRASYKVTITPKDESV